MTKEKDEVIERIVNLYKQVYGNNNINLVELKEKPIKRLKQIMQSLAYEVQLKQ